MKSNPEDVKCEMQAAQERMRQAQIRGDVVYVTYMGKPLEELAALSRGAPLPELVVDREAIREALKESRKRHTVKVKSVLP